MGEEIKDVNKKVDEMESAVKKYASKDTVISIGGYEFTPAKLMVAFTIVSSILGGFSSRTAFTVNSALEYSKFIITEKEADMATPSISKSGAEQKGEVKEWD